MIKKSIVWLLGLAFLNAVMTPEFVFAEQSFGSIGGEIEPTGEQKALILGGVLLAGLLVIGVVYLAKKYETTPTGQPQDEKQESPQSLHFQQSDEQLITPSGQIALISW